MTKIFHWKFVLVQKGFWVWIFRLKLISSETGGPSAFWIIDLQSLSEALTFHPILEKETINLQSPGK